jgi:hypothetical protein
VSRARCCGPRGTRPVQRLGELVVAMVVATRAMACNPHSPSFRSRIRLPLCRALCRPHRVSHTVSSSPCLSLYLPHRVSHCVSLTVFSHCVFHFCLPLCLPLCLPRCLPSPCLSHLPSGFSNLDMERGEVDLGRPCKTAGELRRQPRQKSHTRHTTKLARCGGVGLPPRT